MKIDLSYNNASLTIIPPDHVRVDTYSPAQVEGMNEPFLIDTLLNAGLKPLLGQAPVFLVNDGHRSTPTAQVLSLIEKIDPGCVARSNFVMAAGTHPWPNEMHLAKLFGKHLPKMHDRLTVHIAQDPTLAVPIGRDRFDKQVFLNRQIAEADQIVVISSVEPHYFAGFTGGRKSFFPGSTDLATIERNHNMAASLDAQPMRLDGNPVAEHLDQLLDLINTDKLFSIQVVNDADGQIVGLFAGDIRGSFYEAVRLATEVSSYTAEEPYDLVLAEMRAPLDANLYQAQKALENTQMAVKPGGAGVVVSACAGGIGSEHFYQLADNWDRTTNRPLNGPPRFGSHKLSRVNEMSRKITVGLKSELDPDTVSHVFYEPISDLDQFIADRSRNSKNYRVAVVKDAGNTVLKMK